MALKIGDFDGLQKKFGASVTFQDLSYNMLPKKIQIILNYFLLKKGLWGSGGVGEHAKKW
jgi:hypothetical protein